MSFMVERVTHGALGSRVTRVAVAEQPPDEIDLMPQIRKRKTRTSRASPLIPCLISLSRFSISQILRFYDPNRRR